MGIKKALAKLFSRDNSKTYEKITPDEMELRSYQRKAYLDRVKKKVQYYRKKDTNEFLGGCSILQNGKRRRKFKQRKLLNGRTNLW